MEKQLLPSVEENIRLFQQLFEGDSTVIYRRFATGGASPLSCCMIYCDGMVNNLVINQSVLMALHGFAYENFSPKADRLETIARHGLQINEIKRTRDVDSIVRSIVYGDTLLLCQGCEDGLILNTKGFTMRSISEPDAEQVVRGPHEGFTEGILMNISMLRRKLRTPDLKFEFIELGEKTKTTVCLCYLKGTTPDSLLETLRGRLRSISIDGILDANYIQELIRDRPFSSFKTIGNTERPDVVTSKLLEGRAAILVDGSPVVLTAPYILMEQFQSSEDYYVSWHYAAIGRMIRILGFFFSLSIVPVYVALITYHREMLPAPLLFSISSAREGVPFSSFFESLLLLGAFEILRESGSRTPSGIGTTLSIVGTLVVGQAAVDARFISAPMVIIVAFSGITGLMMPRLKGSILLWRFLLLLMAGWLGLYGYLLGMLTLLAHLCSLSSFGVPVLSQAAPLADRHEDSYIRYPWRFMRGFGRFLSEDRHEKN